MDANGEDANFDNGFILPPLLLQLKKILEQYPDDSAILKELIQNAEDAGAREIKFLHDKNTYGKDGKLLHHPGLAKYQGPALYAYNDGLFTDDDWRGIRMLNQSIKQNDPFKVGYFGMGFKSVFHITDVPFILSGDKLGVIEPHQQIFPSASHGWNIAKGESLNQLIPQQVEPFQGIFGCDRNTFEDGFFNGTLFRFPLRTGKSALSESVYSAEKLADLYENFKYDAHFLLLFLRNLECIQLYERDQHAKAANLVFEVKISDSCLNDVRKLRKAFANQTIDYTSNDAITCTYVLTIEVTEYSKQTTNTQEYSYLVNNYFSGGSMSASFRNLARDNDLHYSPLVGAAMPLQTIGGADDIYQLDDSDGHVFCFLPLPFEQKTPTGLPVHVNGFFALEQNRKYIKWPSTFRARRDMLDKRLLWNQCLLQEAIPKAYAQLLLESIRLHKTGRESRINMELIYRAFPSFSRVDRNWEVILVPLFTQLLNEKVVCTSAKNSAWVHPKEAIFNTLEDDAVAPVILDVLASSNVAIAQVPKHVLEAVRRCCNINLGTVTPAIVANAYRTAQNTISIDRNEKLELLRYILKQRKYDLLDGLELLPLDNGGFTVFCYNPRKAAHPIYILSDDIQHTVLPGAHDHIYDTEIEGELLAMTKNAVHRGYTQIQIMDKDKFVDLLPTCLPPEWLSGSEVEWDPSVYGHPPQDWLENIWGYLIRHFPRDLSEFEKIPLIPVRRTENRTTLLPLSSGHVLVSRETEGMVLDDSTVDILNKLGIYVIDELPGYIQSHCLVNKRYVFTPSYIGILKCLIKLSNSVGEAKVLDKISHCDNEQKQRLREILAKISQRELNDVYTAFLRKLPLFETLRKRDGSGGKFVSYNDVNLAAPVEVLPLDITKPLIDLSAGCSATLAGLLGVEQLSVTELLSTIVFPDIEDATYTTEEVETVMLYVLRHYNTFLEKDPSLYQALKGLPFMNRKDMLVTPDRFYDPDNEILQKLFFGEENFPGGAYSDPSIVAVLKEIGLRGISEVEPEDVAASGYEIEDMVSAGDVDMTRIIEKSETLMAFLPKIYPRLTEDEAKRLFEDLGETRWVRPLKEAPSFYPRSMGWYTSDNAFETPNDLMPFKYVTIIGSVAPVVSTDVSPDIARMLGWDQPPAADKVMQHFANAITAYNGREKAQYMQVVNNVYDTLSNSAPETVMNLLYEHNISKWIWHGEGFCAPHMIVCNKPFMDLRPFIYSLPTEMTAFKDFFLQCGMQQTCHLPSVLHIIKQKYDNGDSMSDKEIKRDLHICVCVLNELKSTVTDEELGSLQEELVLPLHTENNTTLRMAPLRDCTYCDQEWLRGGHDLETFGEEGEFIRLVHPNVPNTTSEALGVPTLMSRMLDAEELDFSFGQSDSLTHRLNVLLQEYTDGFAVPKELVQNADDAGATEVKLLYDERENRDARTMLIDEGMAECQGPALWAYNDAVFSDEDFTNITKLSGATKDPQTDKIGRFGLGFNAVYNITDVPSFISRQNIVIFDPHTTHLGKSIKNKAKPGIKIDMRKHQKTIRRLCNQFKPFDGIFDCDINTEHGLNSYSATLFRFPLRTKTQAIRSEISQKHYDDREVKQLLEMFMKGCESLLLFSQNVIKISLYHMGKYARSPSEMTEIFTYTKSPVSVLKQLTPLAPISDSANALTSDLQRFIAQCSILKSSTIKLNEAKRQRGQLNKAEVPQSSHIIDVDHIINTQAQRLLGFPSSNGRSHWLIVSQMGAKESLHLAIKENNLIPTAGIAVSLAYDESNRQYYPLKITDPQDSHKTPCGTVFTYLPLPIRSGLPVHVNGAFAVTSSRRYLCEKNQDDKFDTRADWNEALISDAVANTYLFMLEELSRNIHSANYHYHLLWPNPANIQSHFKALVNSFYTEILKNENDSAIMLSTVNNFVSVKDSVFLGEDLQQSEVADIAASVTASCFRADQKEVVLLPNWLRTTLDSFDHDGLIKDRTFNIDRFYKEVLLSNILDVDPHYRDKLLMFALSGQRESLLEFIGDSCCIPVTPHGESLKAPSSLVDPTSSIAQLYKPEDGKFPLGDYARNDVLRVLRTVGMAHDTMSWNEIVERAESIGSCDPNIATPRIKTVLDLIQKKLQARKNENDESDVSKYQETLRQIKFLPLLQSPEHFPVLWESDNYTRGHLMCAKDLFSANCKLLTCLVRPVVDESVFPTIKADVIEFLGLNTTSVPTDIILRQLDVLCNSVEEHALTEREVYNKIHEMCFKIYGRLQEVLGECDDELRDHIHTELANKRFILCHNRFLKPQQIAVKFSHKCDPYLYSLPENLRRNYHELLTFVGMREDFEIQDFVLALQSMYENHREKELNKTDLKLALQLVTLLNSSITDLNQSLSNIVDEMGTIYIPDSNNIMRNSSELCFNEPDCNWLPPKEFTNYSHSHIPYSISKQLGVNTRRQEMLNKHSRGIAFGQRESLTTRIKRILSSYPCDKEILKEILQNADDAGAKEIHFIKDPRRHASEKVFDDTWKQLQGPALCVYNDRPFSDDDLDGIQRLGEGSKGSDPNKTGQYGVGFNCVYHLTDAPSFLTKSPEIGETLCIFDPHAKYVPGASVNEPGRRYDDTSDLREIFTDVFPPYLEDKYSLNNATMFRFPLRDERMTMDSELSDMPFTLEMVDNLFSKFKQEMFDSLLFVNHVNSITLTEIDRISQKLTNTYVVSADLNDTDRLERERFSDYLKTAAREVANGETQPWDIEHREISYILNLADNKGNTEKWLIQQSLGFVNSPEIPANIQDAFKRNDLKLLPRGGVAALLHSSSSDGYERAKKAFCFLPLPIKTDLPVHINGHFALEHEARRGLWYDEDSSFKTSWNELIISNIIAPAYASLLNQLRKELSVDVITENCSLMEVMFEKVPNMDVFKSMFPTVINNHPYWNRLERDFYRHVHDYQVPVLPITKPNNKGGDDTDGISAVEIEWLSTAGVGNTQPYFDDIEDRYTDEPDARMSFSMSSRRSRLSSTPKRGCTKGESLKQTLLSAGFKLVNLPLEVFHAFNSAGVTHVECVSPEAVIKFFRGYRQPGTTCKLGHLPQALENTLFRTERNLRSLLEFCMEDRGTFLVDINGLPLLLCEDNSLREFDTEDPVYLTDHHELLPNCSSMFVHHSLVQTLFADVDIELTPVFQKFDVFSLGGLLQDHLPDTCRTQLLHVKWDKDDDTFPSARWLHMLWMFLKSEYESNIKEQIGEVDPYEFAANFIRPLKNWAILPVHTVKTDRPQPTRTRLSSAYYGSANEPPIDEEYLVPIALLKTVADFEHTSIQNYPLIESFRKLCIPEITTRVVEGGVSQAKASQGISGFVRTLVSSLETPDSMLDALHYATENKSKTYNLRLEECTLILKYFNDCVDSWSHSDASKRRLRELPLFLTTGGQMVHLNEHTIYVVPSDIPEADMDMWVQESGIIFLRRNTALAALYTALNCKPLTTSEVYKNFIFKHFSNLKVASRVSHLEFLRDVKLPQMSDEEREVIVGSLKELKFLQDSDGVFRAASHFNDPHHPVFKLMLNTESFPPAPFSDFKWLDFMRMIGLQHDVTLDSFVLFARELEKECKTSGHDTGAFNKARTLVSHLFKRKNVATEGILEQIRTIRFIPPAKTTTLLAKVFPAYDTEDRYICFEHGIPETHEMLVWSSANMLPDWANPYKLQENDVSFSYDKDDDLSTFDTYKRRIATLLGVSEKPPKDVVLTHVMNIVDMDGIVKLNDVDAYVRKEDVMKPIYRYFQSDCMDDDIIKDALHDKPCIILESGHDLVRPSQVVIDLYEEDQITPYLYKIPTEWGEFKKLFMYLGATSNPTVDQYAAVLQSIHQETNGDRLHPNEMRAAFKAVYELFTGLRKHKQETIDVEALYLPSVDGRLVETTELVFNDDPSYSDRITYFEKPFLVDLSECKISAVNFEDVVKLLPAKNQPLMLTSIVNEKLEDECKMKVLSYGNAEKLKHQLNSRAFANGIIRLIRHEQHRSGNKVDPIVLESIQAQLKKIQVYAVETLKTFLYYNDGEVIPESGTFNECFVEQHLSIDDPAPTWNVFIDSTVSLNEELLVSVAEVVNRIVGGGLLRNSVHYLQPILSCPPHSISKMLDRLKIRPDMSVNLKQPTLPTPGSFIPIEDHHLLRQDFERFESGEYVALELEDDETGGQTFIYATIINKVEPEEGEKTHIVTQKYRVNIGDDRRPIEAIATDLYKFHRVEGFVSRNASMADHSTSSRSFPGTPFTPSTPRDDVFRDFQGNGNQGNGHQAANEENTNGTSEKKYSGKDKLDPNDIFSEFRRTQKSTSSPKSKPKSRSSEARTEETKNEDVKSDDQAGNGETEDKEYDTSYFRSYKDRFNVDEEEEKKKTEKENERNRSRTTSEESPMSPKIEPTRPEKTDEEIEYEQKKDAVANDVSDTLEEAWLLEEKERKKIIKRLLLKWHPDKNIDDQDFATEITQHIHSEIDRLEQGLPRPGIFDGFCSRFTFHNSNPFASSDSFKKNFAEAYKKFYENMNDRAKAHKENREKYKEYFSKEYSSDNREFNFDVPPSFSGSNPQPAQARRFLKQAQEDLRASDNDYDAREPAFEWVCLKAHQAAEKALKAAQFSVDALMSFSHDLVTIAATIEDLELRRLAMKLQKIIGNPSKLYAPDPVEFRVIPHDEYTKDMACDAVMASGDILERVKEFIEIKIGISEEEQQQAEEAQQQQGEYAGEQPPEQ